MQVIRRLLYLPIVALLVGSLLSIFDLMHFGVRLPVSVEVVAGIAGGILALLAVVDMRVTTTSYVHPEPEEPPRSTKIIYPKVLEDTVESFQEAEEFVVKANGRVKINIDIEEEPEDEA